MLKLVCCVRVDSADPHSACVTMTLAWPHIQSRRGLVLDSKIESSGLAMSIGGDRLSQYYALENFRKTAD